MKPRIISIAQDILNAQLKGLTSLQQQLDASFIQACDLILKCSGHVVVTGLGKSGHIGRKIAATLASTGTPAFFLHPTEASHGDMGMITGDVVILALSYSGRTVELTQLMPAFRHMNHPVITITGQADSPLAQGADVSLVIPGLREACPLGLAPTTSSSATLLLGDTLAMTISRVREFSQQDFAKRHPGGQLGQRLHLQVMDIMHQGEAIPQVSPHTTIGDALVEITRKKFGCTAVVDQQQHVLGIFTDGDLRRVLDKPRLELRQEPIGTYMTTNCRTIQADLLANEALLIMEQHKITTLLVTDPDQRLIGVIHLHDLLSRGLHVS